MQNLKGSQTEKNIFAALRGESLARNKYTFFEEQARKEGFEDVAKMYEKMSKNETMHAKLWFKLLNEGLGDTLSNLKASAEGENDEWTSMYPAFARTAREEGYEEIAKMFEQVAQIEKDHEYTFLKTYLDLRSSGNTPTETKETAPAPVAETVVVKKEKTVYRCMFCGAVFDKRPDVCPVCEAIGSFEAGTARADD